MYPMMLNLVDKKVLIVGGGKVAFRKVKGLLDYGAQIKAVSKEWISDFEEIRDQIECITDGYTEGYMADVWIVVAATDNKILNDEIGIAALERRILCNVVTNPELSSFIVPSYVKRGDLVISVSTGGNSPSLAAKIRREIEELYPEEYEEYVARLGRLREGILAQNKPEIERKALLNHLVTLTKEELMKYENSDNPC